MTDVRDLLRQAAPMPSQSLDVDALLKQARRVPVRRRLAPWLFGLLAVVGAGIPLRGTLVPAGNGEAAPTTTTTLPSTWHTLEKSIEIQVPADREEPTDGCGATDTGDRTVTTFECSYTAAEPGSYAGHGRWRIEIDRGGLVHVIDSETSPPGCPGPSVIRPGDKVKATVYVSGRRPSDSYVYVGAEIRCVR